MFNKFSINDRTFGVEIEFFNVTREVVCRELRARGIEAEVQRYNHSDSDTTWKLVTDSTVNPQGCGNQNEGNPGNEVVSPILLGEEGYRQLKIVTEVLNDLGAKVDKTCGLHVHLEAQDMSLSAWKNVLCIYNNFQATINEFMSPSRRQENRWCGCYSDYEMNRALKSTNLNSMMDECSDRYKTVNLVAFMRHHTIEFRQHGGTTDYEKILNWIQTVMAIQQHAINTPAVIGNRKYTSNSKEQWENFSATLRFAGIEDSVRKYISKRRRAFMKKMAA